MRFEIVKKHTYLQETYVSTEEEDQMVLNKGVTAVLPISLLCVKVFTGSIITGYSNIVVENKTGKMANQDNIADIPMK